MRSVAEDVEPGSSSSAEPEPVSYDSSFELTIQDIKAALIDSLYGTERGLTARSEVRAEINELISQLEAKNPNPSPTDAMDKLDGEWKLVYTSNSELMAILALSKLPFVSVGDVTQTIEVLGMTVENKVALTVPFSRTALSTTASFEVRSPKRLQLKLERGKVATPQLLADIELPNTVTVLGQAVDLTALKSAISPMQSSVRGLLEQVNNIVRQGPELAFPIQSERAQTWQLNTFADDELRITRGDGGSVFIYTRNTPAAEEPLYAA